MYDNYSRLIVLMDKLPSKHRDILLYKYTYGLSNDEIAKEVNIGLDSVKMYLKIGRYKLLKLMEG